MQLNIDLIALGARLLTVASIFILLKTLARGIFMHAVLFLPATFAHELAHLLLGVLFRAQPVGFSIWPKKVAPGRYMLGHVAFGSLTWWKKLPVATAPLPLLLLFPLGCWLVHASLAMPGPQWVILLYCLAAAQCFAGCWPSSQDWALASTAIYVLLALGSIGLIAYFWFAASA
jgi:hypothetical protein